MNYLSSFTIFTAKVRIIFELSKFLVLFHTQTFAAHTEAIFAS